jgi:hypothetical protein
MTPFIEDSRKRMDLMKIKPGWIGQKELYETQLGYPIISKKDFIRDLKAAIETNAGYAAGRIGISEQFWMYYPILLRDGINKTKLRVFEKHLFFHGSQQGLFPVQSDFYLKYNEFYVEKIREIDCLGLILDPVMGPKLILFYSLTNKLIYFKDQIPDKSSPSNPENCYLHFFEDKKLLLICPFAELLKERATKEIFEGVWSKTGKKWFHPKGVEALEIPYGFAGETHQKYASTILLLEAIEAEIERRDFDIALIGAGGLTIPIASFVKEIGKVSVSLGGDLQILFGVIGKRWRHLERWGKGYFNEWWVDMPEKYRPKETDIAEGAYW